MTASAAPAATTNPVAQVVALAKSLNLTTEQLEQAAEQLGACAGAATVVMGRAWAESLYEIRTDGRQLTDTRWARVRSTPEFQNLAETMADAGQDAMDGAFYSAGIR